MTTPNPRGTVRCTFWDKLAFAVAERASVHWSFDDVAHRQSILAARRLRLGAKRDAALADTLAML